MQALLCLTFLVLFKGRVGQGLLLFMYNPEVVLAQFGGFSLLFQTD